MQQYHHVYIWTYHMLHGHDLDHFLTSHFIIVSKGLFMSQWQSKKPPFLTVTSWAETAEANCALICNNWSPCFYRNIASTLHSHPPCIIILLYYSYIRGIKWSSNDGIIYRNYFWDNISSDKSSYHVRPRDVLRFHVGLIT